LIFTVTNGITNAAYTVLMSTNVASPLAGWIAVATNIATGGSFTLTATNAVNPAATGQFYLLRSKWRETTLSPRASTTNFRAA